ncbi:MAG: hypothetical protein KGY99_06100 [Phycisphaerae bacterium]|nr:hypothetical protein [Phycisphaerae bacterium]
MTALCTDRDILAVEPLVYLSGTAPVQALAAGDDGQIAATSFTSPGSDFAACGAAIGMVLVATTGSGAPPRAMEVVSVDGATALTVSVLRADASADPVPPTPGQDLSFELRTYAAQIAGVSIALTETLRTAGEADAIAVADFADSVQLARTCTLGVLADVFTARAENAAADDANWIKATHYRRAFAAAQVQLRLVVDADADGQAESQRTLGNVTLRRT